MQILVFQKNEKLALSPYLRLKEYQCKCHRKDCTKVLVYTETVRSFRDLRRAYGKKIRVNSAFRCQKHNDKVGGHPDSYHKIGAAMDLRPWDDMYTAEELDKLQDFAELYFDVVLRYDSFIHCHNKGEDEPWNANN